MSMTGCNFKVNAADANKVAPILEEFSFSPETDSDGNIVDLDFVGVRLCDHRKMCDRIAPYAEDGSYIEMRGEDDAMWRWVFKHGKCHNINAAVSWPEIP
jgi:hypothetical protein